MENVIVTHLDNMIFDLDRISKPIALFFVTIKFYLAVSHFLGPENKAYFKLTLGPTEEDIYKKITWYCLIETYKFLPFYTLLGLMKSFNGIKPLLEFIFQGKAILLNDKYLF